MSNVDIEKLTDFKVEIEFKNIVDEYAKECVDKVQANARSVLKQHRGDYVKGWVSEEDTSRVGKKRKGKDYAVKVWNKTDWQLTHLLENGHLITNKRNGVGWASAHPHIDKAFRSVKNRFFKAMQNVDTKVDIK